MSDAAPNPSPLRRVDDEARALALQLLGSARHAALGVIDAETGAQMVSRIALAQSPAGAPMTLVSDLARHTAALRARPDCSLLLGEPGARGDPLTHPRLTLQARAIFVPRDGADHAALRAAYLAQCPKAALYADFADFHLVLFAKRAAFLNGGFGKAWELSPADLGD